MIPLIIPRVALWSWWYHGSSICHLILLEIRMPYITMHAQFPGNDFT
jgi:hypothetical protein